jgi:hypothetical protein
MLKATATRQAHRLHEGLRRLLRLIFGWPKLTLSYFDENHVVAVLMPGGALGLSS